MSTALTIRVGIEHEVDFVYLGRTQRHPCNPGFLNELSGDRVIHEEWAIKVSTDPRPGGVGRGLSLRRPVTSLFPVR